MYLRTKMMFFRWSLLFLAVSIMSVAFIFWALPENMQKLDLHGDDTRVDYSSNYYTDPPPGP